MKKIVPGCKVSYFYLKCGFKGTREYIFEGEDANYVYLYNEKDDHIIQIARNEIAYIKGDWKESADSLKGAYRTADNLKGAYR